VIWRYPIATNVLGPASVRVLHKALVGILAFPSQVLARGMA
jgi:hypothetical protein